MRRKRLRPDWRTLPPKRMIPAMSRLQLALHGCSMRIQMDASDWQRINEQCFAAAEQLAKILPIGRSIYQMQDDLWLGLARLSAVHLHPVPEWSNGKIIAVNYVYGHDQ